MAKRSKNRVKLEQQYRKIGIIHGVNGTGLGEIKKGVANNAPKAACPTCPLTTQHTLTQDVRALANGHCKYTTKIYFRNVIIEKI